MKHPILYRTAIYGIIFGLCSAIFLLLSFMTEAPFNSKDMRASYFHGCNMGGPRPLTNEHVAHCADIADKFKETLDDLDHQMEKMDDAI